MFRNPQKQIQFGSRESVILLQRTLPTSAENFVNFCRELCQLLQRSFCVTLKYCLFPKISGKLILQSTWQNGRVFRGKRAHGVLPVFAMRRTKYSDKQRIFHFLPCCFHIFRNFVSAKPAHRGRAGHKKLYGIPAFSSNLSVGDGGSEESLPPRRRRVEAGERRLRTLSFCTIKLRKFETCRRR